MVWALFQFFLIMTSARNATDARNATHATRKFWSFPWRATEHAAIGIMESREVMGFAMHPGALIGNNAARALQAAARKSDKTVLL